MKSAELAAYWESNADAWTRYSRRGHDVQRDALNTPAFLAMLPSIGGLCGLDVGCGEGSNTRALARLGAKMHAIDIASTFIRHARVAEEADPLGIAFFAAPVFLHIRAQNRANEDGPPALAELGPRMASAALRLELHRRVCSAYSPARIYTGERVLANKEQKRSNREAKKPKQKKKGADKRAASNKGLMSKA